MNQTPLVDNALVVEVKELIQSAKQRAVVAVNVELTLLYWQVGKRIADEVLNGERAEYGKQVIDHLARDLTLAFGKGWNKKQLHHCLRFAEAFPEPAIVSALRRQLSWTHFKSLIYLDDSLKREFYLAMAVQERWSTRTLVERIDKQLFERTALSKKPELTISSELALLREQGLVNENLILKDPYILDFLDLNDSYLEKDLEDAILRELQQFLLELGSGFSFVARQYRMQIDNDDFYIDLLFYNRKLKRLVAIDLKVGNFKAEYKGQMELYLRWLAKYEQETDENPPLGIILCAGKNQEQIELLELAGSGIHVAEYLTALPPKEVLEQRLHQAMINARLRLDNKNE
ncbi:PDDEXK nuclease domain-containing protein [Methylobacter sp.]|uniref:PDDEXK nuclease domain-containing protein n=1 Tax=Methylobacter sp. TaxID=2051955 RepID=UPI002FDCE56F